MGEPLDAQITTRVTARDKVELERAASKRRMEPLALARILIREGTRRERHPGILFRIGEGGRQASLEGHRLAVWQVMETVWANAGEVEQAADFLGLSLTQVRAAVAYYADYPAEIDEIIERNREMGDQLEQEWRRRQAALRRPANGEPQRLAERPRARPRPR